MKAELRAVGVRAAAVEREVVLALAEGGAVLVECAVAGERVGRGAGCVGRAVGVTIAGDTVRLSSRDGMLTLGFVSRRRALLRSLKQVAPGLRFGEEIDPLCPT